MAKFFEGKTGLIYAGLIGLVASDLIPSLGDYLYIKFHKSLRDKWTKGEITSKDYWRKELGNYYLLNSSYWLVVGLAVYFTPKYENKLKVGLGLIFAGAVASIVYKSIKKDEQENLSEQNALKEQLLSQLSNEELQQFIGNIKQNGKKV